MVQLNKTKPILTGAIELKGIEKSYGVVKALQSVTLNIRGGEFFSILGPSGCGKTTLLRIIGGFETPTVGDVLIDDISVIDIPPYHRCTNMIFQHLALFPHMTVSENISFGLEMKRRPIAEIKKRVSEALNLVRLNGLGERKIEELSGGQRQRVAMARAMVNDPHVLLLDEPLGALDLQLRLKMQVELRSLHKSAQSTFVLVTHDQGEAMALSDRIAVMNNGEVLQVGTPNQIYEHPESRFVAEFMGHSNFIPCRVVESNEDGYAIVELDGRRFEGRCRSKPVQGSSATLALRYEQMSCELSKKIDMVEQCVNATVTDVIYMGANVRVEARMLNDILLCADIPVYERKAEFVVGELLRFSWNREIALVLTD